MKLEMIHTNKNIIFFRDADKNSSVSRKIFTAKGRKYFVYKKKRIYIDEFIPLQDDRLLLIY